MTWDPGICLNCGHPIRDHRGFLHHPNPPIPVIQPAGEGGRRWRAGSQSVGEVRQVAPPPQPTKRCSTCLERKTLDSFYKQTRSKDGLMGRCKRCFLAKQAQYKVARS